ncbi:MAG: glycosyltransferase family 4 protein [bacterium]|nr:glycosyltransferase family 4 protein [bacterium]
MRILFLPGSATSPSARFRLLQFVEPLQRAGHEVVVRVVQPDRMWQPDRQHRLSQVITQRWQAVQHVVNGVQSIRDADDFDVIMMNRDIIPETSVTFLEPLLARRNPRIIFDFDDAIHVGVRAPKMAKILPLYAHVTPGNPFLAAYARTLNQQVTILPTVVDTDQYAVAAQRPPGKLRIGWSGSSYTGKAMLPLLEGIITTLAQRHDFEFIIISNTDPGIRWQGVQMRYIPWTEATEVEMLQWIDIGLMPLRDDVFERGKCGLKAIQYMAVGTPAIVSPVGVNVDVVRDGETGYHASSDEAWIAHIERLMQDSALRAQLGAQARTHVEQHYSITSLMPTMTAIFHKVAGR